MAVIAPTALASAPVQEPLLNPILMLVIAAIIVFAASRARWRKNPDNTDGSDTPKVAQSVDIGPSIFISYRRSDSQAICGRLYDRLKDKFGSDKIFRDVDGVNFGLDFVDMISESIKSTKVGLVLIGPDWLTGGEDGSNDRRIDHEHDMVRLEVSALLKKGVPVIPLLIADTHMPASIELPEDIRGIARRNGLRLRHDPDFKNDVDRIADSIAGYLD
ncbi:MAG: TIR domain-containing protein [Pseudomonadota bacterium]